MLRPSAPCVERLFNCARMEAISDCRGGAVEASIWLLRRAVCPTSATILTRGRGPRGWRRRRGKGWISERLRHEEVHGSGARFGDDTGAAQMPQFPVMTVVTPCEIFGSMAGVRRMAVSSWVWVSMKPGARV